MIRLPIALLVVGGLAASTLIPSADAQTATKPEPGCAGLAAKDAENDTTGGENQEITGLFFRTVGSKTTANIQIKNLDQTIPVDGTGVTWYVVWEAADGFHFVNADIDTFAGLTFNTGTYDATTGYSTTGQTAGKLHEGANGVIELTVPSEAGAGRGKTLGDPYANATTSRSVPLVGGLVSTVDAAPDEGGGKDYVVTPCEGDVPPTVNPGTGDTPATLPVTALTKTIKAKKTRRKRATISLRADDAVSDVGLRLRKGTKTAGTGKVANIASGATAKVRLKLKRKLKKGKYVLEVSGTSQGRKGTNAFNIRVK